MTIAAPGDEAPAETATGKPLLAQRGPPPETRRGADAPASSQRRPAERPVAPGAPGAPPDEPLVRRGRRLFVEGCSSCHGFDARGIPGRAPSLRGVGAAAADFYLSTGRMPLDDPEDQPVRNQTFYDRDDRRALIAYVAQFGGPPIPEVHPERGNLARGQELFTETCAGCHQIVAQGGATNGARIPDLQNVEPVTIGEAIDIGPFLMPHFRHLSDDDVDSIARYIEWTRDPVDRGGWGIGHIGPIPEGMITFFLGLAALVLSIRLIGERTTE